MTMCYAYNEKARRNFRCSSGCTTSEDVFVPSVRGVLLAYWHQGANPTPKTLNIMFVYNDEDDDDEKMSPSLKK